MSTSTPGAPSRRRFLAGVASATAALTLGLTACGTSGPGAANSGGGSGKGLTMWALQDQTVLKASVDAFNEDHPDSTIDLRLFSNDDYRDKLRVAFGAGQQPNIFFNYGGGALQDYVKAGKALPLPSGVDTSRFLSSVTDAATFDGKAYGIPCNGLAPVVLYFNKQVLSDAGVQPPTTWDELLAAVDTLKGKGVTPISLAAGSKWPTLMYEEYLVDRLGGSDVFAKIQSGDTSAWTDDAVTEANAKLRQLVQAGAFGDNAASTIYDQGASTALLYTGKAAMELMGTWEYPAIVKADPDFVSSGNLGYTSFPSLEGGQGDPKSIVGNLSNYLTLTEGTSTEQQQTAAEYFGKYVLNDDQVSQYLDAGSVSPTTDFASALEASDAPDKDWLQFVYGLVSDAPSFQLSWDQALPAAAADPLLSNLDQVFLGQIEPSAFGQAMSKVSGS